MRGVVKLPILSCAVYWRHMPERNQAQHIEDTILRRARMARDTLKQLYRKSPRTEYEDHLFNKAKFEIEAYSELSMDPENAISKQTAGELLVIQTQAQTLRILSYYPPSAFDQFVAETEGEFDQFLATT